MPSGRETAVATPVTRRRFIAGGGAALVAFALLPGCTPSASPSRRRGPVPDPVGFLRTDWGNDPFAGGSYSYLAVGSRPADRATLATPVDGRLFFAGEALSTGYPATVHGAYLSGEEAARRVIDATSSGDHIVVVGAGVAGLAAAQRLTDSGRTVVVVEGRDRIGGRIHTDDSLGVPLDRGASWIHGVDGNPISRLADQAGVEAVTTDYDDLVLYDGDGAPFDAELLEDLAERLQEALEDPDPGPMQALVDDLAADLSATGRRRLDALATAMVEHELGGPVSDLDARAWWEGEEFGGGDVLFPGGYGWLPEWLAQGLDVRLGLTIDRIDISGEPTVSAAGEEWRAGAVVVTVPLGVLKAGSIDFVPRLPAGHRDAISHLGMGLLDKLVLRFDRVFWDRRDVIAYIPPAGSLGRWVEWYDLSRVTGEPILMGFNAADVAADLSSLTDDQMVASAMAVLRRIYE